jgi:hypothetical protein
MKVRECVVRGLMAVMGGVVGGMIATLCLQGAFAGAEQKSDVPDAIRARRFEVVDQKGNVVASLADYGELGAQLNMPKFQDKDPMRGMTLSAEALRFNGLNDDHGWYTSNVFGLSGKGGGIIGITVLGRPTLLVGKGIALSEKHGVIEMSVSKGKPSVTLWDEEGRSRAVIGVTGLEKTATGEEIETAPSSIVLFDKENKVIFRVPQS